MEKPGAPRRNPPVERRTDPTGSFGLISLPLAGAAADRAPGSPAEDLPLEEEDGNGNRAAFEPLPDLPGGLVVRYSGAMDIQAGAWFVDLILHHMEAGDIRLALDLSGLQWAGSGTGIGHLTGILKAIKSRNGRLVLFGIPPKIDEVFLLLGFHQYFEIVDTEAEAEALLKRNPAGLEEPTFPKIFKCPICGARTRAARPIRGRCRTCKTLLAVDEHGMVFLG
jgi:anti-anti-sigma factor